MKKTLAFALIAQAVSIGIIIIFSLQFFKQLKAFSDYTAQVEHTYLVINRLTHTETLLKDAETSSRGFIITDDNLFLEPLNNAKTEIFESLDSLRLLIADNPEQRRLYRTLEKTAYQKMVFQVENARYKNRISHDSLVTRMIGGRLVMEEFLETVADMKTNELALLGNRKRQKDLYQARLPEQVRIVFLIAGLSTLIFGFWIFVELKKRFRFQEILQLKLQELRQNNEELEQMAFAASHDLQEPLRKIRIFSDRLLLKMNTGSDADMVTMTQRMNLSAASMQDLLDDLVRFNSLVQKNNQADFDAISLDEIVGQEQRALENVKGKFAIEKNVLPVVRAPRDQLSMLFKELFSNAFEFRSPDRNLEIQITCERLSGNKIESLPAEMRNQYYYQIRFMDNGIGFEELYKDKMFRPFQRLHNYDTEKETRRKGMGLAICKRIMLNLNGWIDAKGEVGKGAIIYLCFPVL